MNAGKHFGHQRVESKEARQLREPGEARPLSRALQKVWVFRFFDPGLGRPPEGPPGLSVGLPGASGGLRKPTQKT